jgi:hypothetical protein
MACTGPNRSEFDQNEYSRSDETSYFHLFYEKSANLKGELRSNQLIDVRL